ncbi:methyltransferase, putative [gamma proteobacterium HTCC5015]|nr:methyltransferase, putative [gamma proteobacterium HTCC5015]
MAKGVDEPSLAGLVDFEKLDALLRNSVEDKWLEPWLSGLPEFTHRACQPQRWGDLPQWWQSVHAMPQVVASDCDFSAEAVRIGRADDVSDEQRAAIRQGLLNIKPWRKGPFEIFGIDLDSEWRSNWKWARVEPHLDLHNKRVLDVGCGNGYYALRMLGAGAQWVLGVDPSPRFLIHYAALRRFVPQHPDFHILPLGLEQLPLDLPLFDTVLSMGVLYHRRSPFDHLIELKRKLRPGGQLLLETLVVEGDQHTVLVPEDRYAQMRNVWCLPSVAALEHWLKRVGFTEIETVDVSDTTIEEQRATEWMTFQSLENFLDPNDHSKTIEGHPAPRRASVIARTPK